MKKRSVISILLVIAMLMSLTAAATPVMGAVALADPGFEGNIWSDGVWSYWLPDGESWSGKAVESFSYSSDSWMTPATDGGAQCVKFYLSTAGSFYFTQVLTDVPAGTYTVTVDSMGADGETVYVKLGDQLGDVTQTDSGYNNWTKSSGNFTLDQNCEELIVGVYVTCSAGGWGYFDNLTLTQQTPEPEEPEELAELSLPNGDFETGDSTNWTLEGFATVGIDSWAANNTTNTLSLWLSDSAAAAGSASYDVTLTAGTYYFGFDVEGQAVNSGLSATVSDGTAILAQSEAVTTAGWDSWATYTTPEFTLTEETKVTFCLSGTAPAAYWGHLDDLKLYGTGQLVQIAPEPVEADIYVPYIAGTDGDFMRGMDVSSVLSVMNSGATFKDWDGNTLDGQGFFDLLADSGVNWVRLRVWNDPYDAQGNGYGGGNCDLDAAVTMGKWATNAGIRVFIDFHYSDFWADPAKQQAPKAWASMSLSEKEAAIYDYTLSSLNTLRSAGVDVGMVQIGNETTSKFCGTSGWEDICTLFSSGARAVRAVDEDILIAIHFTNPERSNYSGYAGYLDTYDVDYDVFASSYYPYWHGTLDNLTAELKKVADTYGKQVIVAETSWTYTLEDGDGHANTVRKGNNDSDPAYSFSVQGQATEVSSVTQAVRKVGDAGIGVFYWEAAWIPVQVYDGSDEILEANKALWEAYGSGWASSYAGEYDPDDAGVWYGGSAVDNQALFDFQGNPLDSLKVFAYMQTGTSGFEITITGVESPALEYTVGDTLTLPESLTVSFSFGADETRAVTWNADDVAAVDMNTPGVYTVKGTVEGDAEAVCTVTVKKENLLQNPSFEDSDMSMYTSSQAYAKRTTDDPYTGRYSLHFYNSGIVDFTTEQTVTLEPGHYQFSLFGQGGDLGEGAATYTYVKIGDQLLTADFSLTGWNAWVDPQISFGVAEQTQVTVGVSVTAAQNGGWGTFDDWYLCEQSEPVHSGGKATCSKLAICQECGGSYGQLDAQNHAGQTELRNAAEATATEYGYTGDTYCLDCSEMIHAGQPIAPTGQPSEPDTPTEPGTPETPSVPNTGDGFDLTAVMGLMLLSVMALTALVIFKRRFF